MTLDTSPPFTKTESILPRASDVARCPRRSVMFTIPGTATEADPALLCVPGSPSSFLGLELCTISVSVTPRVGEGDAKREPAELHEHVVNVCMRLTDGSGRAYGPALTLVACRVGGSNNGVPLAPHQGALGVVSSRVAIPIASGCKVVLFTKTSSFLPPDAVVVHVTAHALFDSQRAADRMMLSGTLGRLMKNCDAVGGGGAPRILQSRDAAQHASNRNLAVVSEEDVPREEEALQTTQLPPANAAVQQPSRESNTVVVQRVLSVRTLKRGRSDHESSSQDDQPPPLEYRFVPGGADES